MKTKNVSMTTILIFSLLIIPDVEELSAKPLKEKRLFNLDSDSLNSILGLGLAGGAGLLLGQALGGFGRGNIFGRRRNNLGFGGFPGFGRGFPGPFGGFGKRNSNKQNEDPFDKTEENIISSMFELMVKTDPAECYQRLICEAASGENQFESLHPFLNFASSAEDLFVPSRFMDYSGKLKLAKQFGEDSGNHETCENEYQCPFTGLEINDAIKEKFPGGVVNK